MPQRTSVTAEDLRAECLKTRYKKQLARPDVFPSAENWQYIIERRMTGIGTGLYRKFLVSWLMDEDSRCDYHQAALKYFPQYIAEVEREYALKIVYADIDSCPEASISVIHQAKLFSAQYLLRLLSDTGAPNSRLPFVVSCLTAYQPEYTRQDLQTMRTLLSAVREPDPLGEIRQSRTILGSVTKYICPKGHINDITCNYCHSAGCGLNIYGLTEEQDAIIEEYSHRTEALAALLG